MFSFQDYLKFNQSEDAQKQQQLFDQTTLSDECLQQLKNLTTEQHLLVLAEPFCPDCLVFVPVIEKMAEANSYIKLKYLPRSELDNEAKFDSLKQQKIVKETYNIPSLFKITPQQTTVIYKEFPEKLKAKMTANPTDFETLKQDYRQGKYRQLIEQQILQALF